ncbi:hypothetical protein V1264_002111 [Littorina saxatilis]|uniref:Uncharacterized protein n=1 Tax=Littorina saxatilis TaxID=31220 RepID=A0AAN9C326_9CAEN
MTLGNRIDSNGARPVRIHQAGAAPGSAPQRSPPSATGGPFISSCGARGRERKATGRKNSRAKDNPTINIMHWNAEGVSNKKEELEHFLYENSIFFFFFFCVRGLKLPRTLVFLHEWNFTCMTVFTPPFRQPYAAFGGSMLGIFVFL